jgi:S-DNA-T family DNA segregation ATPase FtsK/SpoIIIE
VAGLATTPLKEAGQESGNWLGLLGAWAAQLFIYKLFGIASFALIPIVFFLGYKIVFRTAAGSVSYVLALGLFTMAWLSVLLGYVVVTLATPGTDPTLAHRLDFLCGGVGFEAASWLDSLIGWGTVLLLAFILISFVVFFFNVTSLNLGFARSGAGEEADEDAILAAEIEAEQAAMAAPTPVKNPAAEKEPQVSAATSSARVEAGGMELINRTPKPAGASSLSLRPRWGRPVCP